MSTCRWFLIATSLFDTARSLPAVGPEITTNDLPFYYPQVSQQIIAQAGDVAAFGSKRLLQTPGLDVTDFDVGQQEIMDRLGLSAQDFVITNSYTDSAKVHHIYASEMVNGIIVDNHNCGAHVQNGSVIAYSTSFTSSQANLVKRSITVAPANPQISLDDAVKTASDIYKAPLEEGYKPKLVYLATSSGDLALAHQFQLRDDAKSIWYQVSVDAFSGKAIQVVNYYNDFQIKAIPLPKIGANDGFEVIQDPVYTKSSPRGWGDIATEGNNVISQIGTGTFKASSNQDFTKFTWQKDEEPDSEDNKDAAIVNNFYISNVVHDISYQYGFDEESGNFQNENFDKGGRGGDRVVVFNQADGLNNANFATPPDGQSGVMRMFKFARSTPNRDSSLDNQIVIHEYAHGISNRLTGGSASGHCLQTLRARGMGEGWSDALAIYLTRKSSDEDDDEVTMGSYASNNRNGFRSKPYSTSMRQNPYTLSSTRDFTEVHRIGEYWAVILFEMYWNLVSEKGFSSNLYDSKQIKGNVIALQLVIGGMKLQPCNPTFTTARDAIIAADKAYYNGAYNCLIWKAFAKRGLGVDSNESAFKDGFSLPSSCPAPERECSWNPFSRKRWCGWPW